MVYLPLMDRDHVCPSFVGLKGSLLMSHRIQLRMPNVPGFFSRHCLMISLRMCENINFPTVAENMYSSMTAISQPLTGRNRQGEEVV